MHQYLLRMVSACVTCMLVVAVASSADAVPQRKVSVTFDDLPIAGSVPRDAATRRTMTLSLLHTLARHDIPAIGFVNEHKLYSKGDLKPDSVDLLRLWLAAGMDLGNHSFSHPDLNQTPLAEFQADVLRGEINIRKLLAEREKTPEYFRHPFLRTGRDMETKLGLEKFLGEHGYQVAPVSIDNSEYVFARAYDLALEEIGADYIDYMLSVFAFYEDQSQQLFDRNIAHVLLLHANQLNADWFDALAARLVDLGYEFITLGEALEDSAYASEDTYTGPGGITWLHRWALTMCRLIRRDKRQQ